MINKTILGYTILSRIGEGGMAEVYYAENKIGKKSAIKFLKKQFCFDQNIVERFYNEAKVMVALDHPNIRQVLDYDELDGQPAIIVVEVGSQAHAIAVFRVGVAKIQVIGIKMVFDLLYDLSIIN